MNTSSLALIATLSAAPFAAWADANPSFDDDAKPILRMQPGLLQYVEQRFDVKETGTAKFPGDDDRAPSPPYIFRARPIGSHGPFYLRLLIQPGQPGHILGVVDINKVHLKVPPDESFGAPGANQPPATAQTPPAPEPPPAPPAPGNPSVQIPELSAGPVDQQPPQTPAAPKAPSAPAAAQTPAAPPDEPTADTPSGPIQDSSTQNQQPAQPSLAPPPDPAPPAQ